MYKMQKFNTIPNNFPTSCKAFNLNMTLVVTNFHRPPRLSLSHSVVIIVKNLFVLKQTVFVFQKTYSQRCEYCADRQ